MSRWSHVQPLKNFNCIVKVEGPSEWKINEQFFSIQGEGHFTGTPSWFIRLQGCAVGCPWCDSKSTWESTGPVIKLGDILRGLPYDARHVVITGGEPFEQNIRRLLTCLWNEGRSVQIETSGCYDVYGPGWITVSPKFFKPLSTQALKAANEIKQVVAHKTDIERMQDEVLPHVNQFVPVYLQPVSNGSRAIKLCVEACKRYGYKLSLQTHKLIGVP
jgi:7-carboxy-7-deazaguanine synthase